MTSRPSTPNRPCAHVNEIGARCQNHATGVGPLCPSHRSKRQRVKRGRTAPKDRTAFSEAY